MMKTFIFLLSLTFTSLASAAAYGAEFLCDLRIGAENNEVLVVRDRPVRIDDIKSQTSVQAAFVDVFEDINSIIQKKTYAHSRFLLQAYWAEGSREPRPELSIGLYFNNRMNVKQPKEVSKATGDARTQVRLNALLPNDMPIEFSCRNKEYEI